MDGFGQCCGEPSLKYYILQINKIYLNYFYHFKTNISAPYLWDKYNPISQINRLSDGKQLKAQDKLGETLISHDHWLEFGDSSPSTEDDKQDTKTRRYVKREKVLLITPYYVTENCMTVFNTSEAKQ